MLLILPTLPQKSLIGQRLGFGFGFGFGFGGRGFGREKHCFLIPRKN